MAVIRKAKGGDLDAVSQIFEEIHDAEEAGRAVIGWVRGVYPTRATAEAALARGDLFVLEEGTAAAGAAIINRLQVDCYRDGKWRFPAPADGVMVLHTLVIRPSAAGRGYGTAFVSFYEDYARGRGCPFLRMDTNARNTAARKLYRKLGYQEIGVVPTVFNGIPGVQLVLLEKYLDAAGAAPVVRPARYQPAPKTD